MRLKVLCRYCGSSFHGFQRQINGIAVQQVLEEAFSTVLNHPVTIHGCSRTDTGVHAKEFCFHLDTESKIPMLGLTRGVNRLLPGGVAVTEASETEENFHARFDCKGKEYLYLIHNAEWHDPLMENKALHVRSPLDVELLARNAKDFEGIHDFASFCATGGKVMQSTERHIYSVKAALLETDESKIGIYVHGNGFLYNMVRIMVGTLLYIGKGRLEDGSIPKIIAARERLAAGVTAPAHGLYLNRVFY